MSTLEGATARILDRLAARGVPMAVVGGLAVSARTEPRFTRDADLCVAVDGDRQAESLIRDLRDDGYEVVALVEQESTGRIATVRLEAAGFADDGVVVDLVALRAVATRADLDEARRLSGLIDRRGYSRGRDLVAALSMLEARSGG